MEEQVRSIVFSRDKHLRRYGGRLLGGMREDSTEDIESRISANIPKTKGKSAAQGSKSGALPKPAAPKLPFNFLGINPPSQSEGMPSSSSGHADSNLYQQAIEDRVRDAKKLNEQRLREGFKPKEKAAAKGKRGEPKSRHPETLELEIEGEKLELPPGRREISSDDLEQIRLRYLQHRARQETPQLEFDVKKLPCFEGQIDYDLVREGMPLSFVYF